MEITDVTTLNYHIVSIINIILNKYDNSKIYISRENEHTNIEISSVNSNASEISSVNSNASETSSVNSDDSVGNYSIYDRFKYFISNFNTKWIPKLKYIA